MTLTSSKPSTKRAHACRRPTKTWKRLGTNCLTGKAKQQPGGNLWNEQQSFTAAAASSPLFGAKTLYALRCPVQKPISSFIAGSEAEIAGTGTLRTHKCHFTEPLDIQHSRFSDNRQN